METKKITKEHSLYSLSKNKSELVVEAATAALAIGGVGLAIGVANFINGTVRGEMTKAKLNEISKKIDTVLNNQKDILNELSVIFTEIKWNSVINDIAPSVHNISYSFKTMLTLTEGDNSGANDWAKAVLDQNNGIAKDISLIEDVIQGSEILSAPIMKIYTEKIDKVSTGQSEYYSAMAYLRLLFDIQEKGYILIANAYSYSNPDGDVAKFMQPYDNKFEEQLEFNKPFIQDLNQYYKNSVYGSEFYDTHSKHNHYASTEIVKAQPNTIVTGIQLSLLANQLTLTLRTAKLCSNGLVDSETSGWNPAAFNKGFFDIGKDANHYVDTTPVEVPEGFVVIGAALYKKNNRLAIKLQSVLIDSKTGILDYTSEIWTDSPGDGHGKDNFFNTSGKNHYINTAAVAPSPQSYITGAQLYLFGNRTAIKVKTSFFGFPK